MIEFVEEAKSVLNSNWRSGFTVPSKELYPFQWNWDAGFVALGLANMDMQRAIFEMNSLFSGQWENGMLPHIIFHSEHETSYFPNHDFWETNVNRGSSQRPKTSGITQPAVHGFILGELLKRYPEHEDLLQYVKIIYPKIVNYHRFLYEYRDPFKEGLMFIYHPWESGRDNSPLWDESLDRITLTPGSIPTYQRKDTSIADPTERPTSYQYDRYVFLLELGKKYQYDGKGIADESPFLIQDSLMNSILIKSNASLIEMGKKFRFDTSEVEEWQSQSVRSYDEKLWSQELGMYTGYDLRSNSQLPYKEIGGLTPIFTDIPSKERAGLINDYLVSLNKRNFYICPSFDVDDILFDSKRYWRGPIWPQMNWMLYQGLKSHGFTDTAQIVKSDLIQLIEKFGFYEYFESQKNVAEDLQKGYGGDCFSWTAACIIDLITHR